MHRIAYLACAVGLLFSTACRDDDPNNPGTDAGPGDGPIPGGEVSIQQVQNDAMPVGTQIELRGVVVTAIDTFGSRTGDFFVSEPEGGPFSGVKVFGAPLDQVALLQPGDIVDITNAIKHEACTQSAPCGSVVFDNGESTTQVMGVTAGSLVVTKVGTGEVPDPAEVDAKAIAAMTAAERNAEWEKWEGVLIKVVNARQLSDVRTFGSNPGADSTEFRITGVARVQSVLVELPESAETGVCYESVTGVGDFFFNRIIAPRSAADLVGGGTDCFPMAESISELRSAATPPELVKLTDVYVSAVAFNKKNFWVSSSLTAEPGNGVYVFRGSNASELPSTVIPGAAVTVFGAAEEFDGNNGGDTVTQVTAPTITVTAESQGTVAPVTGVSVSDLNAPATGEPYEGVLVTLTNVKLNTLGTSNNHYISDLAEYPGSIAFKADDDIYRFVAEDADACYAEITGVWSYNAFNDFYAFLPLAAGTGTGDCN